MGDVLTLVEKAEAAIKEEDAEAMTKRMLSAKFDFNDFLKQYKMVSGMGSMGRHHEDAARRARMASASPGARCMEALQHSDQCTCGFPYIGKARRDVAVPRLTRH